MSYTEVFNKKGQWHNEHGPAQSFDDGSYRYAIAGKDHRENGPALLLMPNYNQSFYINGHRIE